MSEKTRKYGGAPTGKGLELFAKLAVTENRLIIADVLVGSGTMPDDAYVGDMEQLVEPVGIGTCSEPVRNGATVNLTVECRSDLNKELTNGMTIREFLIRAWDGEEKIPIYYGCLADYPQYVAPWEEGYLDVRRYPVKIQLAPAVDVELDTTLPSVVMTLDDIKDYCVTTLLPQLLTASQNQIVNHNRAQDAHPDMREEIQTVREAAQEAKEAADNAKQAADDAAQAAESSAGGCAVELTFPEETAGQKYSVTGGDGESHTGTVPESLKVAVTVKSCNTEYTVTSTGKDGTVYTNTVTTGPYFGPVRAEVTDFAENITVSAKPGAVITLECEGQKYTGTADESGTAVITVRKEGTYTVTARLNGEVSRGEITTGGGGQTSEVELTEYQKDINTDSVARYRRVFEPEDWADGKLRIPQTEHGMTPRTEACLCAIRQRVGRTAADYNAGTAAQGRADLTACVQAALNANASAPGTYPTAEDGHPQLTWNQVQYFLLEDVLAPEETAAAKAVELGFSWRDLDSTGAETDVTLDQVLAAAYLPALGGVSTGLDDLCTAEVLRGLRLRRKETGVGDVDCYDLNGELAANTWAALGTGSEWDLETGELVLKSEYAYTGDVLALG